MEILWNAARVLLVAIIVVTVGEISKRYPRTGALLLSLPVVSILAILVGWFRHHDLKTISALARDTLVLVPLGLPFFVPLAFATRIGLGFWPAFVVGIVSASIIIGVWLLLAPGQ